MEDATTTTPETQTQHASPRGGYRGGRGGGYSRGGGYKKWVPKGQQAEGGESQDGQQQQHQEERPRTYKPRGGYRGSGGAPHQGPPEEFKNYWRYYNEARKPTTELPKPEDMTLQTEIPALPKEAPKKPVEEDFNALKEAVEAKIQKADEDIKEAIKIAKDMRQGVNSAPSAHDTPEIKAMKEKMGHLREEKKKLHETYNGMKVEAQGFTNEINLINAPKEKLPKAIQKYWTYDKARARLQELDRLQESGNLSKNEESKTITEIDLLRKSISSMPKIANVENKLKELYEKRKVLKAQNDQVFGKIKETGKTMDEISEKITEFYKKIDKERPEQELENQEKRIEDLKAAKRALVTEKRKVDDDYWGAWLNFENSMVEYDQLQRLHKIKAAISKRNKYYEDRAKEIREKEYFTPLADQIDTCEQAIQQFEAEMYMSQKSVSKEESKEEREIVAPKGFSTTKSKEERDEDDLLLEPTKLPGKKQKKKKKVAAGGSVVKSGLQQQREFKLNTLFGALNMAPPEDVSEYPAKLQELRDLKGKLEQQYKEEIEALIQKGLAELEEQRKQEQEMRDRGERPQRGGRGGRGGSRGGRGGHEGGGGRGRGGRGDKRGGRGGGYRGGRGGGRRYSSDEDEVEERTYDAAPKKKAEKQSYPGAEAFPSLE